MARRKPVGYEVRRPLTLWGRKREIGEYIPAQEVASMVRIESMVRSGRFIEVFENPAVKAQHGRTNTRPKTPEPSPEPPAIPVVEVPTKSAPKRKAAKSRSKK